VVFGPRFLIQAVFIIAVAVVAGIANVGTWSIIGLVAAAWILVALVEMGLWARQAKKRRPAAAREPEPEPEPIVVRRDPVPVRTPEPPLIAAAPPPPEPQPEPEAEPEPEPEAEPEPEREPEPVPSVAYLPISSTPREWNLWELERAARDHATGDVVQNEERTYLLMYLREFAGPDGTLPADFDSLVRDAFGDVLSVVAT
jgi:outer membrane biosynthesis protein TonB